MNDGTRADQWMYGAFPRRLTEKKGVLGLRA